MFVISALMLTFIQAPFKLGVLGWVALVPFIYACKKDTKVWRLMLFSYLVAAGYWFANLYWIGYVTVSGYILLSLSLGLYWPVLAICVRFLRRIKFPLFIGVPILITGAEAWQGIIFTGFSWRLLGHSQWQWLEVIQIADIFGDAGVTFLVAMVNGQLAQLIINWGESKNNRITKAANLPGTIIAATLVIAALFYGKYRIDQTPEFITQSPLIGSVQPNVPSRIKEMAEAGELILDDLIVESKECFAAGAKMVVWPETMVLSTMNREYLAQCMEGTKPKRFGDKISALAKDNGYIMFGAHSVDISIVDNEWNLGNRYNSALLYKPDGEQSEQRFDKIHLVPYGEYIPFKDSFPPMHKLGMLLSPYDYDYSLAKGKNYTKFDVSTDEGTFYCGSIICYEDTDPEVTRQMVLDPANKKIASWLVNLSNDGWYVRFKGKKVLPSVELSQRAVITVFRAVENRISIIRSVNTGISCVIDTTGKLCQSFIAGTLPEDPLDRQGIAGWFVDRLNIDKRVTFFSLHGQLLDKICGVIFLIVPILSIGQMRLARKR